MKKIVERINKRKKICFVVMGFGKRMDYRNAREVNLDLVYKKVIRPLLETEFKEYDVIRADEIRRAEMIDVSMYTLLMEADLVIADITTSNENALYELGIRHAVRPYSTIIMAQERTAGELPFDLSHERILMYAPYGETLDDIEADMIKDQLQQFILTSRDGRADSPLYTCLDIIKPRLRKKQTKSIVKAASKSEETISKYIEQAEKLRDANQFIEAYKIWGILHTKLKHNEYITQQYAFACYKSKFPSEGDALKEALKIINELHPESSLDLETLGITGAIYKRLYLITKNDEDLEKALQMYQRGYYIQNDYYNGENYANCLMLKIQKEGLSKEEIISLQVLGRKVYFNLINLILNQMRALKKEDINYWMYATLATSYFCVGNMEQYKHYEQEFFDNTRDNWEQESYRENLKMVKTSLERK